MKTKLIFIFLCAALSIHAQKNSNGKLIVVFDERCIEEFEAIKVNNKPYVDITDSTVNSCNNNHCTIILEDLKPKRNKVTILLKDEKPKLCLFFDNIKVDSSYTTYLMASFSFMCKGPVRMIESGDRATLARLLNQPVRQHYNKMYVYNINDSGYGFLDYSVFKKSETKIDSTDIKSEYFVKLESCTDSNIYHLHYIDNLTSVELPAGIYTATLHKFIKQLPFGTYNSIVSEKVEGVIIRDGRTSLAEFFVENKERKKQSDFYPYNDSHMDRFYQKYKKNIWQEKYMNK